MNIMVFRIFSWICNGDFSFDLDCLSSSLAWTGFKNGASYFIVCVCNNHEEWEIVHSDWSI